MFIGTLARKNEKLACFWHVGTLARWNVGQYSKLGVYQAWQAIHQTLVKVNKVESFLNKMKYFQE